MNPGTPANTRRPNPRNYLHQAPTESPTMQLFQAARKKAAHASNRLPEPRLLAAPDQPRNIATQKLLRTCGTTSRSQGPPTGADRNRLPSSPVLEAVRRLAHLRHTSLRGLLGTELFIAYCNAHATGRINLMTLERFCDEILGWHPACSTATPTTRPRSDCPTRPDSTARGPAKPPGCPLCFGET
jgi:hypothetical protein